MMVIIMIMDSKKITSIAVWRQRYEKETESVQQNEIKIFSFRNHHPKPNITMKKMRLNVLKMKRKSRGSLVDKHYAEKQRKPKLVKKQRKNK